LYIKGSQARLCALLTKMDWGRPVANEVFKEYDRAFVCHCALLKQQVLAVESLSLSSSSTEALSALNTAAYASRKSIELRERIGSMHQEGESAYAQLIQHCLDVLVANVRASVTLIFSTIKGCGLAAVCDVKSDTSTYMHQIRDFLCEWTAQDVDADYRATLCTQLAHTVIAEFVRAIQDCRKDWRCINRCGRSETMYGCAHIAHTPPGRLTEFGHSSNEHIDRQHDACQSVSQDCGKGMEQAGDASDQTRNDTDPASGIDTLRTRSRYW